MKKIINIINQIKATMRFYLSPVRIVAIKGQEKNNAWKGVVKIDC
jgi:hypothetical protein